MRAHRTPFGCGVGEIGDDQFVGESRGNRLQAIGYTVLATSNPALSVRTAIEKGLTYGLNDFIAIGMYAADVGVIAARKGTGYGSLEALVEFARKNPRQLSYASAGTGSVSHFTAELFKLSYGVDIVHVPYSGSGPAKNAIMGGHVPLVSAAYSAFVPLFSSGDLIPLVTTSPKRLSALPDTPTMAEKGFPNATLNIWMGFFVPAGTPPAIVDTLAKALARIAPDPALIAALDKAGLVPDYRDSDATRKQLQLEFDTVSKATEKIKFD